MLRSLLPLLSLVALAAGQGSMAPAITAPASANPTCGGCYVIAGVAAIVFGDEQLTETATQLVSVGVGKNGTHVTTSFQQPVGEFSFNPSGLITTSGEGAGEIQFPPDTIITLSGVTLTSPTAYNVFTAYTETSIVFSNGQCTTVGGVTLTLSSAFLVPIPESADSNFIFAAEQSFIDNLGGVTCLPGGAQVSTTTQIPLNITTVATTVTGPLRPTPIAHSTVASSTGVVSTLTPQAASQGSSAVATASATGGAAGSGGAASSAGGAGSGPTLSPTTTVTSVVSLAYNATGTLIIAGTATSIITGSGPSATIIPFSPFLGAASVISLPSVLVAMVALILPGVFAWML